MHISTPWETGEGDRAHSQPWVEKIKMTSHLHRSPAPPPHYPCHLSFKRWITGFHLLFQTLGARLSLKSVTLTKGHRVNSCASGSVAVLHDHHSNIDSIHLLKQTTAKVCHPRSDGGLTQTCLLLSLVSRNVQLPHVAKQGSLLYVTALSLRV